MAEVSEITVTAAGDPVGEKRLAAGLLIQPWLVLLYPPLDALVSWASSLDDEPRVCVQLEEGEVIEGTVRFSDPFDEGLIAAVELDADSRSRFDPLPALESVTERTAVDAVYSRLTTTAIPTLPSRQDPAALGLGLDLDSPGDWPDEPPAGWPGLRRWPPSGDPVSLSWVCRWLPCCRGCPPNDRCVIPEPYPPFES